MCAAKSRRGSFLFYGGFVSFTVCRPGGPDCCPCGRWESWPSISKKLFEEKKKIKEKEKPRRTLVDVSCRVAFVFFFRTSHDTRRRKKSTVASGREGFPLRKKWLVVDLCSTCDWRIDTVKERHEYVRSVTPLMHFQPLYGERWRQRQAEMCVENQDDRNRYE